jgi:eukaryotic-like serine/threonine-protein kinase
VGTSPRIIDRYALFDEIAAGGMGVVHVGRLAGSQGFSRIVAVKRLHSQFAKDTEFVSMFVDEARLAARVRHPNVVTTLDVVEGEGEILVVMDYVHGETLARVNRSLRERGQRMPFDLAAAILHGALLGLHAAHEAKTEHGASLGIVHRDVSPQNIMIGADGVPRVLDFGVAKASWRSTSTRDGQIKGKLSYMAPEQLNGSEVDRRVDVYAAGIVLWEALTGARLFEGDNPGRLTAAVLAGVREPPSARAPEVPPELDSIVMRALALNPDERFESAMEMATALERAAPIATSRRVSEWLEENAAGLLDARAQYVARVESDSMLAADPLIDVIEGAPESPTRMEPSSGAREPGSLSRAAVTAETALEVTGKRRPLAFAGGLLAVFLAGGAVTLVAGLRPDRETPATVATQPLAETPTPPEPRQAEPLAMPAAALEAEEPQAPEVSTPPEPASSVTAAPAEVPRKTKPTTRAPAAKPPPAPRTPRAASCDPPYTIDGRGVRVPKRECF